MKLCRMLWNDHKQLMNLIPYMGRYVVISNDLSSEVITTVVEGTTTQHCTNILRGKKMVSPFSEHKHYC